MGQLKSRWIRIVAPIFVVITGGTAIGFDSPSGEMSRATIGLSIGETEQVETAIAVVAFVVETVLTVQKNQDTAAVANRLAQIEKRLGIIEAKLDEALAILRNLHVYFQEASDLEARRDVITSWKFIIRKYPTWTQSKTNIAKYREEIRREYELLSHKAIDLATRDSFANFHLVAIAMATENDLMTLLPDQEIFRAATFTTYADYFGGVANPKAIGSVGAMRARVESERKAIESAHAALTKPLYNPLGEEQTNGRCRYELGEPIVGTLQEGYRFKGEHCFYREISCREPRGTEKDDSVLYSATSGVSSSNKPVMDTVELGGKAVALLAEESLDGDKYGRFFCLVNYAPPSIAQLEADRKAWNKLNGDIKVLDEAAAWAKRLQQHSITLAK
jgi:hypothetical protein